MREGRQYLGCAIPYDLIIKQVPVERGFRCAARRESQPLEIRDGGQCMDAFNRFVRLGLTRHEWVPAVWTVIDSMDGAN